MWLSAEPPSELRNTAISQLQRTYVTPGLDADLTMTGSEDRVS